MRMVCEDKYDYEQEDIDRLRARCEELYDLDMEIIDAPTERETDRLMDEKKNLAMEIAMVLSRAVLPNKFHAKWNHIATRKVS